MPLLPRKLLMMLPIAALLSSAGCLRDPAPSTPDSSPAPSDTAPPALSLRDADKDTFTADIDCDDTNRAVHPDATEICDTIDNNCDGLVDGDDAVGATKWARDADGDGFGDPNLSTLACVAPEGYTSDSTDCNDGDATIHPQAEEVCDEGEQLDNDCDGDIATDNAKGVKGAESYYVDKDGDGYGDGRHSAKMCSPGVLYTTTNAEDCDDEDANVNPGQSRFFDTEANGGGCDYNCDGVEEKKLSGVGVCPTTIIGCATDGTPGWKNRAPRCGVTDTYITGCVVVERSRCTEVTELKTQSGR